MGVGPVLSLEHRTADAPDRSRPSYSVPDSPRVLLDETASGAPDQLIQRWQRLESGLCRLPSWNERLLGILAESVIQDHGILSETPAELFGPSWSRLEARIDRKAPVDAPLAEVQEIVQDELARLSERCV